MIDRNRTHTGTAARWNARARRIVAPLALLAIATALISLPGCEPSDRLEAALELQRAGNFEESLEILRELLLERRSDPAVQYAYGLALVRTGQWSLAEWTLREAMQDPEWRMPAGTLLAESALQTLNLPLAVEITTELLEEEPENVDLLMMRANALAHYRQDPEKALADASRIQELDPGHVDVMEPKILALLSLDRIEEAGEALEELGELIESAEAGGRIEGWYCATRAIFAEESGDEDLAAERYADCTERFPTHPDVIKNAIRFFDTRGDIERGTAILRTAQEKRPASRDYRVLLAARLRQTGEPEEAESLLLEAAEQEHPQLAPTAWIDLAKHHQEVGDYGESAVAAGRALAAGKEAGLPLVQLRFEYADSLILARRFEEALAVAEEITLPAHQHLIRARTAQQQGGYHEALGHFDRALQLWPNNVVARYYAALAAEGAGDFERAVEEYRYAARIDPAATDARTRAAHILAAQGSLKTAFGLIQAGKGPPSLDGKLLAVELFARSGQQRQMLEALTSLQMSAPSRLGAAVAAAARGTGERAGAAAAVDLLRQLEANGLSYTEPAMVEVLRALVTWSHEAGRLDAARKTVQAALREHPDDASLRGVQGWAAELAAEPDAAAAAYRTALEQQPDQTAALAGLGRLALASDPGTALSHFQQALATDPAHVESLRGAAEALVALGRREQAIEQLDVLLSTYPLDSAAASRQVELRLEAGQVGDGTLERARRAARFGGGADALELLSRVHRERGENEVADRIAARADRIRKGPEAASGPDEADGKSSSQSGHSSSSPESPGKTPSS